MKIVVLLAALALVAAWEEHLTQPQYQFLFAKFIQQHNKQYDHDEFFARYETFQKNLDMVRLHNTLNTSYSLAMNEFGDMSHEEFVAKYTGLRAIKNDYLRSKNYKDLNVVPNAEVDWRKKGAVSPVQNQQQCGSCWAFSATAALEGAYSIKYGKLVKMSEQYPVDCSTSFGNHGCNGGWMDYAFEFAMAETGGMCTEAEYPYVARDQSCKICNNRIREKVVGYTDVKPETEEQLLQAATIAVVSVAIEADETPFQFYSGGVFDGKCGTNLDHGVAVVGYGTDAGKDYWIVRNSWGSGWGEGGYIRIIRNQNKCGISQAASYVSF